MKITGIKRFAVHDGDGIRTTVFFKGCPLKCAWCHNPEAISFERQIGYYAHKCIGCGECARVCKNHTFKDGVHIFNRGECTACGQCAAVCPVSSLELYGEEKDIKSLCEILKTDKQFYDSSGGGITLSGGECLMFPKECREILYEMKKYGINTAVDTCGYVKRESLDEVLEYTDVFLYDLKAFDENVHVRCTGKSNRIILENLEFLNACGKNIEIRIPYVPGYNSDQIDKINEYVKGMKSVKKVKILPYHNLAGSKYTALGLKNIQPDIPLPNEAEIAAAERKFS